MLDITGKSGGIMLFNTIIGKSDGSGRPNPMTLILTLKVTGFPDAVWQEGNPRTDEQNKKKFIQIGRAVRELFNIVYSVYLLF